MPARSASALAEEAELSRIKRTLAGELKRALARQAISQAELARRMNLGRGAIGRLLRCEDASTNLKFLVRVAAALDVRFRFELTEGSKPGRGNVKGEGSR